MDELLRGRKQIPRMCVSIDPTRRNRITDGKSIHSAADCTTERRSELRTLVQQSVEGSVFRRDFYPVL